MFSLIVALDKNNAIGINNTLPWNLPIDLKWFKEKTLGKRMLMGRKTFDSLPGLLKGRDHYIISRNVIGVKGCYIINDIDSFIENKINDNLNEWMVIGGGEIYSKFIPYINRMYITHVDTIVEGADTFFPYIDMDKFEKVFSEKHNIDQDHKYDFELAIYEKKPE